MPANTVITGPAKILTAPLGSQLPEDTAAFGDAWPTDWVDLGYTDGGITWTFNKTETDIEVDQARSPIAQIPQRLDIQISTNLATATVKNIASALGLGTYSSQAPTSTVPGFEKLTIADEPWTITGLMVGFEARLLDASGAAFRIVLFNAKATGNVSISVPRDNKAVVPVTFQALPDPARNNNLTYIFRYIPVGGEL